MKTTIFSTVSFEATHYWQNCDIDEVKYLKNEHRHLFGIKVYKTVTHNDRDIEFIVLKHRVIEYLEQKYPEHKLGGTSCEMLAEELIKEFDLIKCEVNEDNENGAIVTV